MRTSSRAGAALGLLALLVLVVGSFLPWLHSGSARRNSYSALGVIDRLAGNLNLVERGIVQAWPALGLVSAVIVALYAAGRVVWSTVLALGVALAAGILAVAALSHRGLLGIEVTPVGPLVTLAGAGTAVVAATVILLDRAGCARRPGRKQS